MKILKKSIIMTLLFVLGFLIIGQKHDFKAADCWTLESDGYYYWNDIVTYDYKTLITHNGNPIEMLANNHEELNYDKRKYLEDKISIKLYASDITYMIHEFRSDNYSYLSFNNYEDQLPLIFRYKAKKYDSNSVDLSIAGFSAADYDLRRISFEEAKEYEGTKKEVSFKIKSNPSLFEANETEFIKYYIKNFVHDREIENNNAPYSTIDYSFETAYFVVDFGEETYYYLPIFEHDVIEIGSFFELPLTSGIFEEGYNNIGRVYIEEIDINLFKIEVDYGGSTYVLYVGNLPEHIIKSETVYYFTEKHQKFFIGFYDNEVVWNETSNLDTNLMNNSYIFWNLITGEYNRSELNFVPAKISDTGHKWSKANQLYADIVIPHLIDDLLTISVTYKYQYMNLLGNTGDWITVDEHILLKDETTYVEAPWFSILFKHPIFEDFSRKPVEQIQEIELTRSYQQSYLNWLNDEVKDSYEWENKVFSASDVFPTGSKAYSLFLGNYNKFGSQGVNAKEFSILQYRYEYKGVEYSNPYPKTVAPDYEAPNRLPDIIGGVKSLLDKIWEFLLNYRWLAALALGGLTAPLAVKVVSGIFGKKVLRNRIWIVLGWLGLLFVLFYSLL